MEKERQKLNLTKNRILVLRHLAVNGASYNIYQLAERLNLGYSAVHASISYLKNNGLIKLEKEVENEKGATAKVYGLTLMGLAEIIKSGKLENGDYDKIASQWCDLLPPVLGKWDYFEKEGFGEERMKLLEYIAESVHSHIRFGWFNPNSKKYIAMHEEWKWTLEHFVGYVLDQPPETKLNWLKAIAKDRELKQWIIEELVFQLYCKRYSIIDDAKILWMIKDDEHNWKAVEQMFKNANEVSLDKIFIETGLLGFEPPELKIVSGYKRQRKFLLRPSKKIKSARTKQSS